MALELWDPGDQGAAGSHGSLGIRLCPAERQRLAGADRTGLGEGPAGPEPERQHPRGLLPAGGGWEGGRGVRAGWGPGPELPGLMCFSSPALLRDSRPEDARPGPAGRRAVTPPVPLAGRGLREGAAPLLALTRAVWVPWGRDLHISA